jgi:hypothetical protein
MSEESKNVAQNELSEQDLDKVAGGAGTTSVAPPTIHPVIGPAPTFGPVPTTPAVGPNAINTSRSNIKGN